MLEGKTENAVYDWRHRPEARGWMHLLCIGITSSNARQIGNCPRETWHKHGNFNSQRSLRVVMHYEFTSCYDHYTAIRAICHYKLLSSPALIIDRLVAVSAVCLS